MVELLLAIVAIGGVVAVVYSYALYPLALFVVGALSQGLRDVAFVFRKSERRLEMQRSAAGTEPDWPPVAIVISAYNEERHIVSRIENLLALDYPADRLRAYIGSDGSRDRTAELMGRFAGEPRLVGGDGRGLFSHFGSFRFGVFDCSGSNSEPQAPVHSGVTGRPSFQRG